MAIYDNDGTANYEIGKLYDNDGTVNHQIGAVYDFDGTSDFLIYTDEQTVELLKRSADGTVNTTVWWNSPVSGFSNVALTIEVGGTQDIFFGGISTQEASGDVAISAPSGAIYNIKSVNGNQAGAHSTTLQLDPSATYFVYVGVYTGNKANNGSIKVTAVFS